MNQNDICNEFTESEEKAISKAALLVSFYVFFQGIFIFTINALDKVGTHILYLYSGLALMTIILSVLYFILFFKRLIKIKKYRIRYSIIAVILAVMVSLITYNGFDYSVDIFVGSKSITTNEYIIPFLRNTYICLIDDSGECINIPLTEEFVEELKENPVIEGDAWSDNYLLYHKNTVTIEYYPNSNVLLDAYIN